MLATGHTIGCQKKSHFDVLLCSEKRKTADILSSEKSVHIDVVCDPLSYIGLTVKVDH